MEYIIENKISVNKSLDYCLLYIFTIRNNLDKTNSSSFISQIESHVNIINKHIDLIKNQEETIYNNLETYNNNTKIFKKSENNINNI